MHRHNVREVLTLLQLKLVAGLHSYLKEDPSKMSAHLEEHNGSMPWSQGTCPIPDMGSCALRLSQPPEHQQYLTDPTLTWHILQGLQKCHCSDLTFTEEFATYLHLSLPTRVQKQLKHRTNLQLLTDLLSVSHSLISLFLLEQKAFCNSRGVRL